MDISFLFIGEERVGKKSIVSRFKLMNSTLTVPMVKHEFLEKYKKKTVKKREWEAQTEKDQQLNKQYDKEYEKNNSLFNFKKILKIPSFITIENKFYKIEPVHPIQYDDFNREHLDEVEKKYKVKFDACKADINNVLSIVNGKPNTYLVFAFVFDLSRFDTFEKVLVYYNEIERIYGIKDKYKQILIGNKMDLAFNLHDSEKVKMKNFINDNGLIYYETTTKMMFNFEIFYESIFTNLFRGDNPMFNDKFFFDNFNTVLKSKENFSKSVRATVKPNNVPGPNMYDSNPYDISGKDSLKQVYDNKTKFKNKIFLNKQGPSFGPKLDTKIKQKNTSNAKSLDKRSSQQISTSPKVPLPPEYYQKLYNINYGYTFSTKDNHLGFREKRHSQSLRMSRSFEDIFQSIDNISVRKSQKSLIVNKTEEYDKRREQNQAKKKEQRLKEKKEKEKHRKEVRIRRDLLAKEKLNTTLNKSSLNDSVRQEDQVEDKSPEEEFVTKILKERNQKREDIINQKKQDEVTPGPGTYNIRKEIDMKQGKSFGLKLPIIESKNSRSTGTYTILSDIDELAKKKGQGNFGKGNRFEAFKEKYMYDKEEEEKIFKKKIDRRNKYPEMSDIMSKIVDQVNESIEKRQKRIEDVENQMIQKPEVRYPGPGNYNITDFSTLEQEDEGEGEIKARKWKPAYDLKDAFPKGPAFTMGGRYDKNSLGVKQNYDEQPGKFYGLEQSLSFLSKNVARSLNKLPNFNYVKPRDPLFSIPKSERFQKVKQEDPAALMLMDIMQQQQLLKPNEVEINNNPNKVFYQGKADRFRELNHTMQPGPQKYVIEGFTDKLIRENNRKNQLRMRNNNSTITSTHSKNIDTSVMHDSEEQENQESNKFSMDADMN